MKLPRAILLCLLLLPCHEGWSQSPVASGATIPVKEKFHLYLLMGQSNMAGGGPLPAQKDPPNPRILTLTASNEWVVASDPLHFDAPGRGVGPGMSFARTMLKNEKDTSVVIGLIPCAYSGSKLERWQKGGDLFTNAVTRAKIATEKGTLKGILWHQGESDSQVESDAKSYGARFVQMIRDFREAVGAGELPLVVGKLCDAFEQHGLYPYAKIVNQTIESLPKQVPRTACADAKGLGNKGDGIHFNTESQIEFGRRYAEQMLKLTRAN